MTCAKPRDKPEILTLTVQSALDTKRGFICISDKSSSRGCLKKTKKPQQEFLATSLLGRIIFKLQSPTQPFNNQCNMAQNRK